MQQREVLASQRQDKPDLWPDFHPGVSPKSRDDRMRSVREPTNSGTFGVIWDMMSYVFCKNVGRACGFSLYSESMSENHPMNWFLYHITLNDTVYTTVTIWIHNSMLFASWSTYCPMKRIRVSMHLPSIVAVSVCKFGFASCAGTLDFSIVRGTYGRNLWLWRENTRQGVRSTGASTTFWEGKWKVTRPQHLHTQTMQVSSNFGIATPKHGCSCFWFTPLRYIRWLFIIKLQIEATLRAPRRERKWIACHRDRSP